jgi:uncharacterized protein YndB with AHSA1/START domain
MMAKDAVAGHSGGGYETPVPTALVQVSRIFAADRERVYHAWTEPEAVRHWFGPALGGAQSVEADVRVGGRYRINIKSPPARPGTCVVGKFLEVDPPKRLVYTFAWEQQLLALGMGESQVTVEFLEQGGATEIRLTHELLDKRRVVAFHRWGWKISLKRLARLLR